MYVIYIDSCKETLVMNMPDVKDEFLYDTLEAIKGFQDTLLGTKKVTFGYVPVISNTLIDGRTVHLIKTNSGLNRIFLIDSENTIPEGTMPDVNKIAGEIKSLFSEIRSQRRIADMDLSKYTWSEAVLNRMLVCEGIFEMFQSSPWQIAGIENEGKPTTFILCFTDYDQKIGEVGVQRILSERRNNITTVSIEPTTSVKQ